MGGWAVGRDERRFQRVLQYIDTVLAHGGGRHFDIMNFHEYSDDCDFQTHAHHAA